MKGERQEEMTLKQKLKLVFDDDLRTKSSCLLWPKITNAVIKIVFYVKFNAFFAIRCGYLIFFALKKMEISCVFWKLFVLLHRNMDRYGKQCFSS